MPEMIFLVRWPDASQTAYYSPSRVIHEYFTVGEDYNLPEFLNRSRVALRLASERVRAKYGFACARASASLAAIERHATPFTAQADARIKIMEFQP
jgi:uncharacterized repeat protein (TIGR04042 family)